MIELLCICGTRLQVLEVYAGGNVVCHACGSAVHVPADAPAAEEKFRFRCPHCETRVVARRASAGKKSQCPACAKVYIVPEPPPGEAPLPNGDNRRISLDLDDLALRLSLPFPVGKLDQNPPPPPPRPRYLHSPEEVGDKLNEGQAPLVSHDAQPDNRFFVPLPPPDDVSPLEPDEPPVAIEARAWTPKTPAWFPGPATPHVPPAVHPLEGVPTSPAIEPLVTESESPGVGELRIISGSCRGERIRIDFHRLVVGTERDCDLRPVNAHLSRHHCVFKKDEYALRVRDLGSVNGTFVNGRRISGEAILKPGDEVTVGDVTLHVYLPQFPAITHSVADSNPSISDFVIL